MADTPKEEVKATARKLCVAFREGEIALPRALQMIAEDMFVYPAHYSDYDKDIVRAALRSLNDKGYIE